MEIANWLDWQDILQENIPQGRIYLGCECCENMLPGSDRIRQCIERLDKAHREVTLVTPIVTEKGLDRVTGLMDQVAKDGRRIEVVCNDWGVFEVVLQFKNCTPVIGRLLSHQCTDPRFSLINDAEYQTVFEKDVTHLDGTVARLKHRQPSTELLNHIRTPAVIHQEFLEYLHALGVSRFEISNLLQGIVLNSVPANWHVSLHAPTVIIAVRRCREAAAGKCNSTCHASVQRIDDPSFSVPLFISPCDVFYLNDNFDQNEPKNGVDRLVFQKRGTIG